MNRLDASVSRHFALLATALVWGTGIARAQTPDYTKANYANSPILRKFVDSLPGLGPSGANNLGQYIPIATKIANPLFPNDDYYELGLVDYSEKMHSDLPVTKLRGYKDLAPGAVGNVAQYLGPLIIAERNRPVRLKFTNMLGTGTAGDLFLPVDTTLMGAGYGPLGAAAGLYTQNRAELHLHGGLTPWISDGTPHQWFTPAGEPSQYKTGISFRNVPDMGDPGEGSATYYYPNQQSGRLMFYHDHVAGLTRLNVYAGEAAGYLITDPSQSSLVSSGAVPNNLIPLIIQDKTFVDEDNIDANDPTWNKDLWGRQGSLWFPHVYQPSQDLSSPDGENPKGRWDYGAWVFPTAATDGPLPTISSVPEAYMDTPVINGTAYPFLNVEPRRYRFLILNACNDRFMNLGIYLAQSNTPDPEDGLQKLSGEADFSTEAIAQAPGIVQFANEAGITPAPVVYGHQTITYDNDYTSPTFGNVKGHNLLIPAAGRAEVVVDFSKYAPGTKLILYNDCPAPVPGGDDRYDYYTGDPDQRFFGGAATTELGYGPNTRTIMQFRVVPLTGDADTDTEATTITKLASVLPTLFDSTQDPLLVPAGVTVPLNATTTTFGGKTYPVRMKTLNGDFDHLGRLVANLGTNTEHLNSQGLPTMALDYESAPTEVLPYNELQVWRIRNRDADSHPIHFHLVNVQLINRVDANGRVTLPEPDEAGWREVVRCNPGEDAIIAMKAVQPVLPFTLPESSRPLNPTMPVDPIMNPITNFGYEYVWHCHILGHEESDMMRPIVAVPPAPPVLPTKLVATPSSSVASVGLRWLDNATTEQGYRVTRSTTPTFAVGTTTTIQLPLNTTTYTDAGLSIASTYYYRVVAFNTAAVSVYGNTAAAKTIGPPTLPTKLTATPSVADPSVTLNWLDNSTNEDGFTLSRSTTSTFSAGTVVTVSLPANTTTYVDSTTVSTTRYYYRIVAFNGVGSSTYANTAGVTTLSPPNGPTYITAAVAGADSVTISWLDNSLNEQGFHIIRSTTSNFAAGTTTVLSSGPDTTSMTDTTVAPGTRYYYRVTAYNGIGESTYGNTASVTTP